MPTDNIGNWFEIGTLTVSESWQLYNEGAINGRLFRLSFITDWQQWEEYMGYWSFGLLRFYYRDATGNFNIVDSAIKIYPKREQHLLELPIPQPLQANTYVMRIPGIKLIVRTRPYPRASAFTGNPLQPIPWSLKLEYLVV